jgi:hypothetical protein
MKRLIALVVVLVVVLGASFIAVANNDDYKNASQFCEANEDLGVSHGKCVSTVNACFRDGNTGPVCICKFFLYALPDDFYTEFNNLGECISYIRHGYVFE